MSGRGRIAERGEKKSWKTMTNALINLYCINFFIVINKNRRKLTRTFAPNNFSVSDKISDIYIEHYEIFHPSSNK